MNFEKAKDTREEGTAKWLFEEPLFKSWESLQTGTGSSQKTPSDNVLWVRGSSSHAK
jgi:hypothetical protein